MTAVLPLIAGALLALTELGFSLRRPAEDRRSSTLARIVWAVAAGLGGVVTAALVLLAATPHVGRSVLVTMAGTAAAVIVVATLSRGRSRR